MDAARHKEEEIRVKIDRNDTNADWKKVTERNKNLIYEQKEGIPTNASGGYN